MRLNILMKSSFIVFAVAGVLSSCSSHQKPALYQVKIEQMKFVPEEISVNKGDTIIWINNDMVAHDITAQDKSWTSSALQPGQTWKMAVTNNADYYCSIHQVMKGKIKLK